MRVYDVAVTWPCSVRVFDVAVMWPCSVRVYDLAVTWPCSVRVFDVAVTLPCSDDVCAACAADADGHKQRTAASGSVYPAVCC